MPNNDNRYANDYYHVAHVNLHAGSNLGRSEWHHHHTSAGHNLTCPDDHCLADDLNKLIHDDSGWLNYFGPRDHDHASDDDVSSGVS